MSEFLRVEQYQESVHGSLDIAGIHLGVRRWQEEVGQNVFPNIHSSQSELGSIQSRFIDEGGNFFIARGTDDTVRGFVGLIAETEDVGLVKRMAVVPEYHRQGVGTLLFAELIDWSKANDFEKLKLTTGVGEQGLHIYKAFGFQIVGYDSEFNDHLMELNLIN